MNVLVAPPMNFPPIPQAGDRLGFGGGQDVAMRGTLGRTLEH
ncbi:MAG TPA: hypothetical protein VLA52_13360 [Thermohalobaculum sp.]|nr:hypothetical protein [Thermohalobaculum sp.]